MTVYTDEMYGFAVLAVKVVLASAGILAGAVAALVAMFGLH
jgi:hypothetical protein